MTNGQQIVIARDLIQNLNEQRRRALAAWLTELLLIRNSGESTKSKALYAAQISTRLDIVRPVIVLLYSKLKCAGWMNDPGAHLLGCPLLLHRPYFSMDRVRE